MLRSVAPTVAASLLVAGLSFAEPTVEVRYHSGVPQVSLTGSYPGSQYTIWRASAPEGPFANITNLGVLCLGPCYGEDFAALPGRTYWYRFDLILADGNPASFGPFAVTISPSLASRVRASVHPNPARGASRVELFLAGAATESPVDARAVVYDLHGRAIRTLWRGPLARGATRLSWDGRDDTGRDLDPGQYFLRLSSPLGSDIARVVRVR